VITRELLNSIWSLHIHNTSMADVQQKEIIWSLWWWITLLYLTDIISSGSKWNVHILLYPLSPISIISAEMNYITSILYFLQLLPSFVMSVFIFIYRPTIISQSHSKARPQARTQVVVVALVSLQQSPLSGQNTRHDVIDTVYTNSSKLCSQEMCCSKVSKNKI